MAPVKEAMAHRIQAAELRQGTWGPISLYVDAPRSFTGPPRIRYPGR